MKILLVAATAAEIQPTIDFLTAQKVENVHTLITGIGALPTAYHLGRYFCEHPDTTLAINAGIAGTFRQDWALGDVVQVASDVQADLGVELANGGWQSMFDLGLESPDAPPYYKGRLVMPAEQIGQFLPAACGISVNRVHGYTESIAKIRVQYPEADIETMEGAAFFYAALLHQQIKPDFRFMALRALSNYVEPRQRENWQIPQAIKNLNQILVNMLAALVL